MRDSSKKVPFGWIMGLVMVVLIGALPAVWASPLGEPARATVPNPDPTPTPRTTVVVCDLLEPCEVSAKTLTVENEGTLPMEGCVINLEQVAGIEYLVEGQALAAPYNLQVPRLLPGEKADIKFDIRLMCEDPAVVPCMSYMVDAQLVCGTQVSLMDQYCVESPCPILPSVGK